MRCSAAALKSRLPLLASLTRPARAEAFDFARERMPSVRGSLLNFKIAALPTTPDINKRPAVIVVIRSVGSNTKNARPVQKTVKVSASVSAVNAQTSNEVVKTYVRSISTICFTHGRTDASFQSSEWMHWKGMEKGTRNRRTVKVNARNRMTGGPESMTCAVKNPCYCQDTNDARPWAESYGEFWVVSSPILEALRQLSPLRRCNIAIEEDRSTISDRSTGFENLVSYCRRHCGRMNCS